MRWMLSVSVLFPAVSMLGAQTFTAPSFAGWSASTSWMNASVSHGSAVSDGNPAPAYEVTVNHSPSLPTNLSRGIFMFVSNSASWLTSQDGPIGTLDMAIDTVTVAGVAARQQCGVLVRQSNRIYIDIRPLMPVSAQWVTVSAQAASVFDLGEVTSGAVLDFNSHPDFSIGAPSIQFGFAVHSQYSLTSETTSLRYDNWSLSVEPLGSFDVVGVGCPSASPASIGAEHRPAVGFSNFVLTGSGAMALCGPTLIGVSFVGFSSTVWNGYPLPADMGPLGAPGCVLRHSPDLNFGAAVSDASGQLRLTLIIPNSPQFLDLNFFSQWLILCPAANPLGLVVSSMGAAVIG